VELLWHLGLDLGRKEEARNYYLKLAESELRQKNFDLGLFHFGQLREHFPDAADRLDAFRKFVAVLFRLSRAQPYPDLDAVQLKKVIAFPTINEYNNSLCALNHRSTLINQ
jgi:hypothetical protein